METVLKIKATAKFIKNISPENIKDIGKAVKSIGNAAKNFDDDIVEYVLKKIERQKTWPSIAEFKAMANQRLAETNTKKFRKHAMKKSIEQAMRSKIGQTAIALGFANAFIVDVQKGNIDPNNVPPDYVNRRRRALIEKKQLAERLAIASQNDPELAGLTETVKRRLIELSVAMDDREKAIAEKYAKKY